MKSDPQRQEDGEEHEQNHSSEDTPARQPTKSQKGVMATKKIFKMPLFLTRLGSDFFRKSTKAEIKENYIARWKANNKKVIMTANQQAGAKESASHVLVSDPHLSQRKEPIGSQGGKQTQVKVLNKKIIGGTSAEVGDGSSISIKANHIVKVKATNNVPSDTLQANPDSMRTTDSQEVKVGSVAPTFDFSKKNRFLQKEADPVADCRTSLTKTADFGFSMRKLSLGNITWGSPAKQAECQSSRFSFGPRGMLMLKPTDPITSPATPLSMSAVVETHKQPLQPQSIATPLPEVSDFRSREPNAAKQILIMPMLGDDSGINKPAAGLQSAVGVTSESKVWSLAGDRTPSSVCSRNRELDLKPKTLTESIAIKEAVEEEEAEPEPAQQMENPMTKPQLEQNPVMQTEQPASSTNLGECVVCFNNPPDVVLMPCGHGGCCRDCCVRMCETEAVCFICKEPIDVALLIDPNKSSIWNR